MSISRHDTVRYLAEYMEDTYRALEDDGDAWLDSLVRDRGPYGPWRSMCEAATEYWITDGAIEESDVLSMGGGDATVDAATELLLEAGLDDMHATSPWRRRAALVEALAGEVEALIQEDDAPWTATELWRLTDDWGYESAWYTMVGRLNEDTGTGEDRWAPDIVEDLLFRRTPGTLLAEVLRTMIRQYHTAHTVVLDREDLPESGVYWYQDGIAVRLCDSDGAAYALDGAPTVFPAAPPAAGLPGLFTYSVTDDGQHIVQPITYLDYAY